MSKITPPRYEGDAKLFPLLQSHGVTLDRAQLLALIEGVLAAPPGHDPAGWTAMLKPATPLDAATIAQLQALKDALADRQRKDARPAQPLAERLNALRAEMKSRRLAAFILPHDDEFRNEYLPASAERLAWATGFTGSAGMAVVTGERAAVFVDGRYATQIKAETPQALFEHRHLIEEPALDWLLPQLRERDMVGYDPALMSADWVRRAEAAIRQKGAMLLPVAGNPVDKLWQDRPAEPLSAVVPHDIAHAGQAADEKRRTIAASLKADALLITRPEDIAWLLNIRGGDIAHTPLPLCRAVLHKDGQVTLFIDARKLTHAAIAALGPEVRVEDPATLPTWLELHAGGGQSLQIDPVACPAIFASKVEKAGGKLVEAENPITLPKALKNHTEIAGSRAAHLTDGVAVTKFLCWLSQEAPKGGLDELAAAARLESFRAAHPDYRGPSFDTITGAGPNGAIVHYRANARTNRLIRPGELYLVDSGGQYLSGTTDITRTLVTGTPTAEMRDRFTRVLKGHIALATASFSEGTAGRDLEILARQPLNQIGLTYDHGTGHGVGSYLSVHEGPQGISKRGTAELKPGMILSNEPGFYKEGAYGIRLENLILVTRRDVEGAQRPVLGFETLTLAPFDTRLVEPALLSDHELDWLNAYHARVRTELTPHLDAATAAWLAEATRPLEKSPGNAPAAGARSNARPARRIAGP